MIKKKLTTVEACQVALDNHLYVSGWCLRSYLVGTVENRTYCYAKQAAVFYDKGLPVAVSIIANTGDIQAFVKPSHRRQGIGTKLVKYLKSIIPEDEAERLDAGHGIQGSTSFWKAVGIKRWDL